MPTPILNKELVKLRRRLGDLYSSNGTEITSSNVGSVDGNIWDADEIVDIYNDAVRDLLEYVVSNFRRDSWYTIIPGYIRYNPSVNIASGRLGLDSFNPSLFFAVSLIQVVSGFTFQFSYITPDEFLLTKGNKFPHRRPSDSERYFTVMSDASGKAVFTIPASTFNSCELVYVREHSDLAVNGSDDLSGVSEVGLRKILDFAEAEAIKQKHGIAPELVSKLLEAKAKAAASEVKVK